MARQFIFSVDLNKCIKCRTCEMSCNAYYGLKDMHRRNILSFNNDGSDNYINLSISCNHCVNPVCVYVCPENNFQKRRDGIVVLKNVNCNACNRCIEACPFHAPKINPQTNRADKCNFCVERIDDGLIPICVENCVTSALTMMEIDLKRVKIKQSLEEADIPIASYSNPSIQVINKINGKKFLR